MTTTPVPIDPRIRERRVAVQRAAGRRRLRVLVAAMAVVCTVGIAYLVVTSPLLDVDRITVTGTQRLSAADIRTATGVRLHEPLLLVDGGAVARRVEALPWVAHASVRRDLPGTLRVSVTEYEPSVYVRASGGVLLVAPNGRVLARAAQAPSAMVEVRGLRRAPAPGELLAPTEAAGVVGRLPAALGQQVVAVDVHDGFTLVLARGGEVRFGTPSDVEAKGDATLAVLAHLGAARFAYIDVSDPQRPVSRD